MDEQVTEQHSVIVDAQEVADELDNFDTRTPAEVEAAGETAEPEEAQAPENPEVEEKEETPVAEEPKTEEKQYQPPRRVTLESKPFEMEIPVDEYGNVDPAKLGEYLQARDTHLKEAARIEAQNANYDIMYGQREWSDVSGAFPELVGSDENKRLIENLRMADAINGGQGSLMEAAQQLNTLLKDAEGRGRESQKSTITRQKSVQVPNSNRTQTTEPSKVSSLRKQAIAGNDSARIGYLQELIDRGEL